MTATAPGRANVWVCQWWQHFISPLVSVVIAPYLITDAFCQQLDGHRFRSCHCSVRIVFLNYKQKRILSNVTKVKLLLILDVLHIFVFLFSFPNSFKSWGDKAVWLYWQHVVSFAEASLGEPVSTMDSSHPHFRVTNKAATAIVDCHYFLPMKGDGARPGY